MTLLLYFRGFQTTLNRDSNAENLSKTRVRCALPIHGEQMFTSILRNAVIFAIFFNLANLK